MMKFHLDEAEYHRNGVNGEGFYVGMARCDVDGEDHNMLITFFPNTNAEGSPHPAANGGRVAVISLDHLDEYGVGIGNKWRGDLFYEVADAIVMEVGA